LFKSAPATNENYLESQFSQKWLSKRYCLALGFALFFFAEVLRPLQLSSIPAKVERALFAFVRAEPQDRSVVLDVHHACAGWEVGAAKRAFSRFRHYASSYNWATIW